MNTHDFRILSTPAGGLSLWGRIRRGVLIAIGCGCLMFGIMLVIAVVRPETLGTLSTAELFSIVALLTMPVLTMLSLKYDRAVVKSVQRAGYQQSLSQSSVAHQAHNRADRPIHHARLADAVEGQIQGQVQPSRAHDAA